jgi:hypothetical protein
MTGDPILERKLANGRLAEVIPLTFGRARICLVSVGCRMSYDDGW